MKVKKIIKTSVYKILKTKNTLKQTLKTNNFGFFDFDNENKIKILKNNTKKDKIFILKKTVKLNKKQILALSIKMDSADVATFKIFDKRLKTIYQVEHDGILRIGELSGTYLLGIKIKPGRQVRLRALEFSAKNEETQMDLGLKNKRLMVVPEYPSRENKYNCAFLHTRLKAYREAGLGVDLLVVNGTQQRHERYEYEGIIVNVISYNQLREVLKRKTYKQILIHFFNEAYAQVLDASDISQTEIYLYSHGADMLYWDYSQYGRKYFEPEYRFTTKDIEQNKRKDLILKRYNKMSNVNFVFVCEWSKKRCEKLLGEKIVNAVIIPCLIDEKVFKYKKKDAESRKKICLIRSFHNLNSYSIDTDVRVILELSRRPFFKELEFSIYGSGEMHEKLLAPLKGFDNVKIYNKFLSAKEMNEMYDKHGIALFATRYDNQAVATLECALSGVIPLTSYGTGLSCFLDEKIGNFSEAEDAVHMADLVEKYYDNPEIFSEASRRVHESIAGSATRVFSIEKEIKILKKFQANNSLFPQKDLNEKPLLSVVVPSYNCAQYLRNSVLSLINHSMNDLVEVIIVNDGSKDDTLAVARELEKNSPSVLVVDKENGGHGSTINAGIKVARGKYFRLMDGDDYFATDDFERFLRRLKTETADIVLTNYVEDLAPLAELKPVRCYDNLPTYQTMNLDDMRYSGYGFKAWGPLLSTTTCKTSLLKEAGFEIDEHCFYVDMEYNLMVYSQATTIVYYPLDIYIYYLGRSGQSVDRSSVAKNYLQHEKVALSLIREFNKMKSSLSVGKKTYIRDRLVSEICNSQYYIVTNYLKDGGKGFRSFDRKMKQYPEFYNSKRIADRMTRAYRITGGRCKHLARIFSVFLPK